LGWDVTWIRVGLILIVLIGWGTIIPIYLVAWLIAPKAVTVAQRLEMQGEDVTVENIKSEINNVKNYVESEKFKRSASSVGDRFLDVIRTLIKIVGGLIGGVLAFVGIIVAFALLIALLSLLFVPSILMGFSPELAAEWTMFTGENAALLVVSLLLVVGAPIYMIVYWAINLIGRKRYEHAKTTSLVVGILWIAGLFMLYSVGAKTIKNWSTNSPNFDFTLNESNEPTVDQTRTIEAFTGLDVSDNIEVEITQDSTHSLVVSAPERVLDRIKTEVVDGTLRIYTDKFMLNQPIKITLSTDSMHSIKASGAAQISTTAPFNATRLYVELSGASHGNLDFAVKGMSQFKLSGASNIDVNGSTAQLEVDASGASDYNGDSFTSLSSRAESSGASNINLHASKKIQADASGTSNIDCTGSPATIIKNESGAANITIN
jgi:Putative auto-transporter adhesin, head GIN domain